MTEDPSQERLPGIVERRLIPTWAVVVAGHLGGRPTSTSDSYRSALRQFGAWCDATGINPLKAQRADVQTYVDELRDQRRLRPRTVHRHTSTIRGAYQYAVDESLMGHNPAARVRLPRVDKRSPGRALGLEELHRFWAAALALSELHHALFHTMAATGVRVSAACAADVADYRYEDEVPILHTPDGKGGKEGVHPLGPRAAEVLDGYLAGRRTGPLFRHPTTGEPLNRFWVGRQCARIATKADLRAGVTPHALRRTWVTHGFDALIPLEAIQDGAGHADPATTRGYDANRRRMDPSHARQLEAFRYADDDEEPDPEDGADLA